VGFGCLRFRWRTNVERGRYIKRAGGVFGNNESGSPGRGCCWTKNAGSQYSGVSDRAQSAAVSRGLRAACVDVNGTNCSHRHHQQNTYECSGASRPRVLAKINYLVQRVTRYRSSDAVCTLNCCLSSLRKCDRAIEQNWPSISVKSL
jgi:hypothetical protein